MNNTKSNILTDHTGKSSAIRWMSFISLIASIYFAKITISMNSDTGLWVTLSFLAASFGPKVFQKMIELKTIKFD